MRLRIGGAVLLVLLTACATGERGSTPAQDGAQWLASSLEAQVRADSVVLTLSVTNSSESAVQLDFRSGQRYDFVVRAGDGEEVWRWSDSQMFTQALGSEVLEPGETLTYSETWHAAGREGTFEAAGVIPAEDARIERRTEFQLPA